MTELSIWIPDTLQAEPTDPRELIVPTIPARNIRSGIIHPDRLPPNLVKLEDVEAAIALHVAEEDPHPQYAPDTHDHPPTSITGLGEAIDDRISSLLVAGLNVALDYNDAANTLTISAVAGGGSAGVASFNGRAGSITLTEADIPAAIARTADLEDHIDDQGLGFHLPAGGVTNAHVALGASIDWAKIAKIGAQPGDIGAAPAVHTHSPASITGLDEAIDDRISSLLVPGANISLSYDDSAGTLTISAASSGGSGGAVWGGIGGNLLNQLDLVSALNTKQDILTRGNITSSSAALTISGGTGATIGSGVALSIANASTATPGFLSAADKIKLDGIASGATANQTDSFLLSRANHTGSQPISTIVGLQSALDGRQPASALLSALAALTPTSNRFIIGNGSSFATRLLTEEDIPSIPASRIGTGVLAAERIPSLASIYQSASSRLTEFVNGFTAAPMLSFPRKNAAGDAIEWAVPANGAVIPEASITSLPTPNHTGTINETIIHTFLLAGNTLTAPGHHLEIQMFIASSGSGNKNWRIRIGGIGGNPIQVISNNSTSNRYLRRIDYRDSGTLFTNATGNISPDQANPGTPIAIPHDWTVDQTFVVTATLAAAADTTNLQSFWVRVFR